MADCSSAIRGAVALQMLLHTVDLFGIVRSALLLLFHHRSAVSASSMESLHCLRGQVASAYTGGWSTIAAALDSMRLTTFGRAIC